MAEVSFVIVNFNSGDWLSRAIESVLRYSDATVYVIDNGSVDTSIIKAKSNDFIVQESGRVEWILNQQNLGFAAANNQALKSLTSEYAILMNPDCELRAGVVDSVLDAFSNNQDVAVVSCLIENTDGSLQKSAKRRFPTPLSALSRVPLIGKALSSYSKQNQFSDFDYGDQVGDDEFEFVEAVSGAFMAIRMSAARQVGFLDEVYFMHFEDLDWCKRFSLNNWRCGVLNTCRILHAKGVSSQARPVRVLNYLHRGMVIYFDRYCRKDYRPVIYASLKLGMHISFFFRAALVLIRSSFRGA